jgi:iron complex transport system ATP-binding protein
MSALKIRDLTVVIDQRLILNRLYFDLPKGQVVGLIGPNGAGKSTLLRACLKLIKAEGAVHVCDQNILELSAYERSRYLSFLPQERDLAWAMTVEATVRLGLPIAPPLFGQETLCDDDRVAQALSALELQDLRRRQATSLSGGELARVLIARLLVQDTPIILADEPLAGLDPQQQIKLMQLFKKLALSGKTIVASIHELSQAALWCDQLILLDHGELVAQGMPKDVLSSGNLAKSYKIHAHMIEQDNRLLVIPISTFN